MKSIGMIRQLDELGRVVLPKELREAFNLKHKDALEIFVEEDKIILRKYEPGDIFDGDMTDLIEYKGRKVSLKTIKNLLEIAKTSGYDV